MSSSFTKHKETNSDTLKTIDGVVATKDEVIAHETDRGSVGPEGAPSGHNNEAALHSKSSESSARPAKPSPPDEDENKKEDHESDSDDDFPVFPGGKPRGKIVGPVTGGQAGRPVRPTRP